MAHETVGSAILDLIDPAQKESVQNVLKTCFSAQDAPDDVKNQENQSWLSWAQSRQHLRISSNEVPMGILPNGANGILHDIKVFTKFGPDDPIYDKHKDIRQRVARGNSFLKLEHNGTSQTICLIHALKKFTGGLGDDDDRESGDNHTWKKYFTKPLESTQQVVCTRKANGEAAHLSARLIDGTVVLCAGSKNVHLLFKDRDDLKYYTEGRYRVAREVVTAILDLLESMPSEKRGLLLSFLHLTEFTGVFEVLQPTYQHVEDLSYLKGPEVRFITWTSCSVRAAEDASLCCMPPHMAIQVARALGLPTIDYTIIPFCDVDQHMHQIRSGYGYEGEVLYFLDADSSVIGLLKKKTIWYIICRAIREKVRTACGQYKKNSDTYSQQASERKISHRIKEIQKWLGLDDNSTRIWAELGNSFLDWCLSRLKRSELEHRQVAEMFPVTWKQFLESSQQTDKIDTVWKEPEGSDE